MNPNSEKIITYEMLQQFLEEKIKEIENKLTDLHLELEFELSLPKL